MDETTGKSVLCPNAAGYGTGRESETVWRAGKTDDEGAEGVYCGGNTVKYIDSIMRLERIMEKMNTIPRMCEDIHRLHMENPVLQAKDYMPSLGIEQTKDYMLSSCIVQERENLMHDVFDLFRKQNDICKNILGNTALGLADTMQAEQTHISLYSALEAMKKHEGISQMLIEGANLGLTLQAAKRQFSALDDFTRSNYGLNTELAMLNDRFIHSVRAFADGLTAFTNSVPYQSVTKVLDQYQYSMDQMFTSIQNLSIDKFESLHQMGMDLEIGDVSISENGDLTYQGMTFEKEVVPQELERQVQELEQEPISLKQKAEKIGEKFWLLFFIVSVAFAIPDLAEKISWYANVAQSIYEAVMDIPQKCYAIKEKSYIRADANAKSKILATLVYDTELEILEDIPRWYKVKYIDETGTETEGWISKISIER